MLFVIIIAILKKDLRKHKFALSHFRKLAHENRSLPENIQKIRFIDLRDSVAKLNLASEDCSTDDILSLTIENTLERRLQILKKIVDYLQ